MNNRLPLWMLVVLVALPAWARAEDTLAEASAREKARRAKQGTAKGKSYTDDDITRLPKPKASPGGSNAAAASTPEPADDSRGSLAAEQLRQDWRGQVAGARAEVANREAELKELEARIREARSESSRPTRIGVANREADIAREITELLEQVEVARKQLDAAKQTLEDLIEEARVAGVPYSQLD